MIQTTKQTAWTDANGVSVPLNRVTKIEKQKETAAAKLLKSATQISSLLEGLKKEMAKASEAFYNEVLKENKADKRERKGNFIWFTFDRSVKIEVSASERIEFKSVEIGLAKEKLNSFISESLSTSDAFIHELVNDAFQTTKGGLDPKKVMGLLKYRSKTKAQKFHEALDLIEKSIERTMSKTYYRISVRNDSGEYEYIKLNFSEV